VSIIKPPNYLADFITLEVHLVLNLNEKNQERRVKVREMSFSFLPLYPLFNPVAEFSSMTLPKYA
jgi:hypothetical protein